MKRAYLLRILCVLVLGSCSVHACPDCSLTAHTIGQPFFAHAIPDQGYQTSPLERNQSREEESQEGCAHCQENHE